MTDIAKDLGLPAGIACADPPSPPADLAANAPWPIKPWRAALYLGCVILGYIGVYLCRKNLSVALPLLKDHFKITKAEAGLISSYSTVTYAIGKIFFGPIIDRFGGRVCFLCALGGVALFGGLEAFVMSAPWFTLLYSANRFSGAAGWGSMAKQVPDWYPARHLGLAMAFLSLSFVFGGVIALLIAGRIAAVTGDQWRAIIGIPSIMLVGILFVCWAILPKGQKAAQSLQASPKAGGFTFAQFGELARTPQFWVVCGLSFFLTITRETFNVWTVDFIKTEGGRTISSGMAALLSTPFDAAGAVGILSLGWLLDRMSWPGRRRLLFLILSTLALLIYALPNVFQSGPAAITVAIAVIGFLSYGPYSLLAGVFAVEIRGKEFVGTVAGLVDASGYLAGIVSGYCFGKLLDVGGYRLGFHFLGLVTVVAAFLCLLLRFKSEPKLRN